jgi:predicted nucleic-acid-binding Zn-ribbon protein
MEFGPVKTKCPRCGSRDLIACEITEASMLFDITDGIMTRLEYSEEFGMFVGINVTCKKCKHRWTPRKAKQVTDLLKDS